MGWFFFGLRGFWGFGGFFEVFLGGFFGFFLGDCDPQTKTKFDMLDEDRIRYFYWF